jgi:purine catabolism regulator
VLIEHDVREHSELVATLAGFLEHNQDYDATARALGIHRSTARYRIHRVAQVTQLELRDPETARSLRAAIRMFNRLSDAR